MYARRDSIVRSDERSVNNIKSILDLKPRNKQIINYCKSLINVRIFGQKETDYPSENSLQENELTLSYFIQSADAFLRSFGNNTEITGHEEEFIYYMQGLLETRGLKNPQRFVTDVKKFLEIYIKRGCPSDRLNHSDYWGSRQQLLAGKVISDFVGEDYGPLDPVFGVLLCPVAGRVGPGDSGIVHELLFDDDGPMAYHSAVHDAFGYLISYHKIGPGYNYTCSGAILESSSCVSGQFSGLNYWRDVLKKEKDKIIEVIL
ncbi:uncharacterized protein LOC101236484 isoform X1 [Hydra vulgaris]|uniref:Uncharacterized protein LOC101236484 isoform X1 n=1 Tax=Hydra vulgaris TaxID=6087 RepID=A0ABM4DG88_HYDVU